MGYFYTNASLRGPESQTILDALRKLGRRAFVISLDRKISVVYEEKMESQYEESIIELGMKLSGELACPLLSVLNHDDDVLRYWLFRSGELIDHYDSFPGCFSEKGGSTSLGGNSELLCETFGLPGVAKEVDQVLHQKDYGLEFQRHLAFAELLELEQELILHGFYDFETRSVPEEVWAKALFVG